MHTLTDHTRAERDLAARLERATRARLARTADRAAARTYAAQHGPVAVLVAAWLDSPR